MIRQTGQNIVSELSLLSIRKNLSLKRWEFEFPIKRSYIEPSAVIDTINRTAIISNSAAQYDGEGQEIVAAGTQVEDFEDLIQDYASLESISFNTALAHAENIGVFSEYIDDTDDLWEDETLPDGLEVKAWESGESVAVGFLRSYNGVNYRAILKHTTQADWTPNVAASLWKVAPTTGGSGYPMWVQPTGAHDAYQIDNIVEWNGFNWRSLVNGNVWEPSDDVGGLWEKLNAV